MFEDENVASKVPKGAAFQVGLSDVDPGGAPLEQDAVIPYASDALPNWVYYDVTLGCLLDSGIVVHRRLPQVNNKADTLASCTITDPDIDALTGLGVNLISEDTFQDTVQRMAHSQYWFRLWGQAMRIGQQVPIPNIEKIAGVDAVPHDRNPQWAYNKIVGNYSGVVLWYAQWDLWYTLAEPPKKAQVPPQNPWQHISGDTAPPKDGYQAPWSSPDEDAQPSDPRM